MIWEMTMLFRVDLKPNPAAMFLAATSLILLSFAMFARPAHSRSQQGTTPVPIVLELFTSEGCSSCPPADTYAERIDRMQPIPGIAVIVLSEHVDYWDHDGWKDPYSSASLTERQSEYEHALGLATPYTPQIIVNGTAVLKGDARQLKAIYDKAADESKLTVRLGSVKVDGEPSDLVRAHVDVDGSSVKHGADIYLAVALDHAESEITAGENSGKRLAYVSVVEELKKVGKLQKGKDFSQDVQLKLKSAPDPRNLRVIAFVQESGPGQVLGAAMQKLD
jgi:hypothetical protein